MTRLRRFLLSTEFPSPQVEANRNHCHSNKDRKNVLTENIEIHNQMTSEMTEWIDEGYDQIKTFTFLRSVLSKKAAGPASLPSGGKTARGFSKLSSWAATRGGWGVGYRSVTEYFWKRNVQEILHSIFPLARTEKYSNYRNKTVIFGRMCGRLIEPNSYPGSSRNVWTLNSLQKIPHDL